MSKKIGILITFVLLLPLVFTACRSETPEQAVTNALNAVKNLDKDTAQKYFSYDELFNRNSESDELVKDEQNIKLIFNKLSFKVISSSKEGNAPTVKTEITNIDMASIMGEFFQKVIALAFSNAFAGNSEKSQEEIDKEAEQILVDLLNREDNKTVTSTIDIKLTKYDNSWKIDANEEFQNAITGGLFNALKNMENSFGDSDAPESKLREIRNFVVSDIQNKGFNDISWFIKYGTGSSGRSLDIDFTLEQLADAMTEKAGYDTYINGLDDEKYAKIKQIWSKLSAEIDKLYSQIQERKPVANDSSYNFDTGIFNQYMDAFTDKVDKLD